MSFIQQYVYTKDKISLIPNFWTNFLDEIYFKNIGNNIVLSTLISQELLNYNCTLLISNSPSYHIDYKSEENYFLFQMIWS